MGFETQQGFVFKKQFFKEMEELKHQSDHVILF